MPAPAPPPAGPGSGPNRLLGVLVFVSLAVHAVLAMYLAGIYRSDTLNAIELTLQAIANPSVREIPRPRLRPKAPQPQETIKNLNVVQQPLPQLKPLTLAPTESDLPDTLMEQIDVPQLPLAPGVDAASWVPAPQAQEAAGEFMTTASYLDMVRLKIESRKRYPDAAKARRLEGRVTVRFVLGADGAVREAVVSRASRHQALDQAALEAVQRAAPFPRPPAHLFEGDLALELIIVFELT